MIHLLGKRNIIVLIICQILFWTTLMTGITVSGLVGQMLAENKAFATIPAGFYALAGILVTRPASLFMQRYGRRLGFMLGAFAGVLGCIVCTIAIFQNSFIMFCVGNAIIGVYQAIGLYYRLAATDSVVPKFRGMAISLIMSGGIVAALISPLLSIWSKDLFAPIIFAGTFAALGVLSAVIMILLMLFEDQKVPEEEQVGEGRPIGEIFRQPLLIVAVVNAAIAQGIMVLIMISTPLAMIACGFDVSNAANVIQWHVLGMFVPSFLTGHLISRFGAPNIALTGAVLLMASIAIAASGIQLLNFSLALILLGAGWNLMYISGTTMVTLAHRPEERGRVQGTSEMIILGVAVVSSFASGALLNGIGWYAVNLGAIPLLLTAVILTWWLTRQTHSRNDVKVSAARAE